jgi:hypothetical protein
LLPQDQRISGNTTEGTRSAPNGTIMQSTLHSFAVSHTSESDLGDEREEESQTHSAPITRGRRPVMHAVASEVMASPRWETPAESSDGGGPSGSDMAASRASLPAVPLSELHSDIARIDEELDQMRESLGRASDALTVAQAASTANPRSPPSKAVRSRSASTVRDGTSASSILELTQLIADAVSAAREGTQRTDPIAARATEQASEHGTAAVPTPPAVPAAAPGSSTESDSPVFSPTAALIERAMRVVAEVRKKTHK